MDLSQFKVNWFMTGKDKDFNSLVTSKIGSMGENIEIW